MSGPNKRIEDQGAEIQVAPVHVIMPAGEPESAANILALAPPADGKAATRQVAAVAAALPKLADAPADLAVRSDALYGAWLCGAVLGHVSMGLHHKLCHTLGGSFNLPHAETHSIVLPHAVRYNQSASEAMRRIERAIGAPDAATGIFDLEKKLGLPLRLADIGMQEADLERAARLATEAPYPNPRKVEYAPVLELLGYHARSVARLQSGSGLWHQMLDKPDSYLETSASAIFVYAIARAINQGWISPVSFGSVAQAGWLGVATRVDARGQVEGTCVGTTSSAIVRKRLSAATTSSCRSAR